MSSEFGQRVVLSLFGESHGPAIGAVVSGLPAGAAVDEDALAAFMARRQGGHAGVSTTRKEPDRPIFLSGLRNGRTTGSPLAILIENTAQRSGDYADLMNRPRPSHADYTAHVRYGGYEDARGGGHFSGRLTAPLCAAGGVCLQMLVSHGIRVRAHALSIAGIQDVPFDPMGGEWIDVSSKAFPTVDDAAGRAMIEAIRAAAAEGDSVGGVVEAMIEGLPAGLGDPLFDGVENLLARALFGLGGVRGVEFGDGFAAAGMRGSRHNDPFTLDANGRIRTRTNHHAGILGGITSGMPVLVRAAFKPTASIGRPQQTVDLASGEETEILVKGRHDPCIVPRAVPCVEAVCALVAMDLLAGGAAAYEEAKEDSHGREQA